MKIKYREEIFPFCSFLKSHMHFGASSQMVYDVPGKGKKHITQLAVLKSDGEGGYIPVGYGEKKGFAIDGEAPGKLKNPELSDKVVGGDCVDHEFHYLAIDAETLLPVITNHPTTFEDMKKVVSSEPRLIAQMDVYLLNPAQSKELLEVAKKAIERILSDQASYTKGEVSQDEFDERTKFVDECVAAAQIFIDACMQRDNNKRKIQNLSM